MHAARPSWAAVVVCGLYGAYGSAVMALALAGHPVPSAPVNSLIVGSAVLAVVVALARDHEMECELAAELAAIRAELAELREQVGTSPAGQRIVERVYVATAPVLTPVAPHVVDDTTPAAGLGPAAIEALRRVNRRLSDND